MNPERLDAIFDADGPAALVAQYDEWAATYDDDHDEWGWRGPQLAAEALLTHVDGGDGLVAPVILDAGCGTGRAGTALRSLGWDGHLIGVDLSTGMLARAVELDVYDELICGSVLDLALPRSSVGAVISTGVFTHGHVGGEGFGELVRVTAAGGVVSITQRLDLLETFAPHDHALIEAGKWQSISRTEPDNLHPEVGDTRQVITTWRVL